MDFNLNETQEMIRDGAQRFFSTKYDSEAARHVEESEQGYTLDNWSEMAELGWTAVALPEAVGGSELSVMELCVLAEEAGRAAASTPLLVSAGLSAHCLMAIQSQPLATKLLSRLASSDTIITTALIDTGSNERSKPSTELKEEGEQATLNGIKLLVPYADDASSLLITAQTANGELAIVAVDRNSKGLTITRQQTLGGDPLYQVKFDNVSVTSECILARGETAITALNRGLEIATVLSMAEAVGNCEGIIKLTAEYATMREQFGKAIGSFQAVSHPIADMRIQTDACRMLLIDTAYLISQGKDASFETASAKVYCNEAMSTIALDGHRLHGAIGYSNEYDLQRYSRRVKAFCVTWGSSQAEIDRAAATLGM